mgnify:CR=1 FL=1
MVAHANWQSMGAGGMHGAYTAHGGTGAVVGRDTMDSLRMGEGRIPSAEYPDTELKTCVSCGQVLPVTKFKFRSQGGRQAGTRHTMCNRCLYVRYTRPNMERKKADIDEYKMARGCFDCGYCDHPSALEFDHLPGSDKKFNIGEEIGKQSKAALWAEIEKCDVVCANCHNIRTYERRSQVGLKGSVL